MVTASRSSDIPLHQSDWSCSATGLVYVRWKETIGEQWLA